MGSVAVAPPPRPPNLPQVDAGRRRSALGAGVLGDIASGAATLKAAPPAPAKRSSALGPGLLGDIAGGVALKKAPLSNPRPPMPSLCDQLKSGMQLKDATKRVLAPASDGGGGDLMSAIASRMAQRRGSIELMEPRTCLSVVQLVGEKRHRVELLPLSRNGAAESLCKVPPKH